jgi:thioredoxin-like negative regulator of GroEL
MKLRSFIKGLVAAAAAFTITTVHADSKSSKPAFEKSYEAVLKKAKASGKPVIVIFSATWCPPCQAMKKDVYPSKEVAAYHDKFEWAYLDTDEASNAEAAKKHRVEGIPHIAFLKSDGQEIDKQVGGSDPADFADTLKGILKKAK